MSCARDARSASESRRTCEVTAAEFARTHTHARARAHTHTHARTRARTHTLTHTRRHVPELQQSVVVVGFPTGGDNLCVTAGVVSRVDVHE